MISLAGILNYHPKCRPPLFMASVFFLYFYNFYNFLKQQLRSKCLVLKFLYP